MRNLVRAVVVSAVLAAGCWTWQEAAAEPAAPLDLELSSAEPRVAPGDPVELTATVTNRAAEPCRLAALADGTVQVTAVTRDGGPVAPEFVQVMYEVSLPSQWAESAREVAPGAEVSFPLATGQQVAAISVLPGGNGVGSRWTVTRPGRYEITAAYRMPFLDGACAGSTGPATVEVVVAEPEADTGVNWWVVGGLAGAVLLALLVVLVVRRRRAATAVVPALLAAAMVLGSWHPVPATADDADFQKELASCMAKLDRVDPAGIMYFFRDTGKVVRIEFKPTTGSSLTTGTDKSLTVAWNPYNRKDFPGDPGVARDPCSSLYHELVHAFDIAQGADVSTPCAKITQNDKQSPPSVGDVRAIRAENAVRRALGDGAGGTRPRTNHGVDGMGRVERLPGRQAPAAGRKPGAAWDSEEVSRDCEVSDTQPPPPPGPHSAHETAGGSDGDPHVTTFDQRRYDFQAVGEFVLAKSGEVEVHVRQAPVDGSRLVSVNTAVGVRVGTDRLTFAMHSDGMRVTLNGEPATFRNADNPLPGGGTVTLHGNETTIGWPDGTEADVLPIGYWGMRFLLYPSTNHKGRFTGLLGDFDGNPANDLITADGTALPEAPDHDRLYGGFADRWRVTQDESLLPYPAGRDTASYTDRTFPDEDTTVDDLDAGAREAARGICAALGITEAARHEDCVLDLALTGRPAFAASAATTEHLVAATERGLSPSPQEPQEPREPPQGGDSAPGGTLRDGDHADAVIEAGETHRYRLDLGDATVFRLHDITGDVGRSGNGSLRIGLEGPGGEGSPGFTVTSNYQYRVQKGGDYTLTVSRVDNDTGEYGFRLVTAKERRMDAAFGDRITGRLAEPGSVDLYVLTATESTEVHLAEGTGCDFEVAIVEESPAPHVYSPSRPCWEITLVKTEPGKRYLLIVWSGVAATGDYSFRIATTR